MNGRADPVSPGRAMGRDRRSAAAATYYTTPYAPSPIVFTSLYEPPSKGMSDGSLFMFRIGACGWKLGSVLCGTLVSEEFIVVIVSGLWRRSSDIIWTLSRGSDAPGRAFFPPNFPDDAFSILTCKISMGPSTPADRQHYLMRDDGIFPSAMKDSTNQTCRKDLASRSSNGNFNTSHAHDHIANVCACVGTALIEYARSRPMLLACSVLCIV